MKARKDPRDREYMIAPRERKQEFLDQGWQESDLPLSGNHGHYSVIMWKYADG